jgi:DNA (cytosine-5)-methyltransferase 1
MSLPNKRQSHEAITAPKNNIRDHSPRFHNQRDIDIFRLLATDIENETYRYTSSKALQQLYTEKTGKLSSVHKYHVLRLDQPSNTIPAHLYKDGLRHIHPDAKQARSITVREAARLQSFPDDFEFKGSNGSKYKMIGNAVPPAFAKKISLALEKALRS